MTTNLMPDDRRSLTIRLSVLQYLVAGAFALLAIGVWIFQIAQHDKFREMAENNPERRGAAAQAAGAAVPRGGGVRVARDRVLDFPDRAARQVPRDGGEQPAAAAVAAGAARRAARPERQGARRESVDDQYRDRPRADEE